MKTNTAIKSEYELQAEKFLTDTKTTFKADLTGHGKYFPDDKETRDIYTITLEREGRKPYSFRFGQSIVDSGTMKANFETSKTFYRSGRFMPSNKEDFSRKRKAPNAYDVLACLTKYELGDFEDFCANSGYDNDSRKAESVYFDCQKEYAEVLRMFGDVMEQLQDIN